MAYLTSSATLADVKAAYESTATYDLDGDLTMCREHIQACRVLIARTVDETRQGSAALRDSAAKYRESERAAVKWLAERDAAYAGDAGAGRVRYISTARMHD